MTEDFDLIVIGGGIVGLATAYRLLERHPDLRLALVEKEPELASHQSGHNSGVLHAGLYYAPGSMKAQLCREGKAALEDFADRHGIPYEHCGKVVVALDEGELPRLEEIKRRSLANGVEGLEEIGPERLRELEPHCLGVKALWSPRTGIIDFRRVALAYAEEVRARGGTIWTGHRVEAIRERGGRQIVSTAQREIVGRHLVACAGLHSDRVARLGGVEPRTGAAGDPSPDDLRIVPFRGDYYTLKPQARRFCRSLIYPVPDPRFPFLGVHLTKRIDGEVWAGPNAVLAFAREGYRLTQVSLPDLVETLGFRGFRKLASRYARTGLEEMWRGISKAAFMRAVARYVPEIGPDDVVYGPSGVRAQALDRDGNLVDDFVLGGGRDVLMVRNAPSPAATASLAIGRVLAEKAAERFALGPPRVSA